MTHQRVLDVCETLLIQPVLLDGIVYEVKGSMADDVGRTRVACKESETGLPRGAFRSQAFEIFYRLPAQLLARGRVEGDLNGILDLKGLGRE
jgi:hypothetical protein